MKRCDTCLYQDRRTFTCDFFLMTGMRRRSPVDDCERWTDRDGRNHIPHLVVAKEPAKKQEKKPIPLAEKIMPLYERGMNDAQIARAVGCNKVTVWLWRDKRGLPSNARRGRPRKEVDS